MEKDGTVVYDIATIALAAGVEQYYIKSVLDYLVHQQMISIQDRIIEICNWKKYNPAPGELFVRIFPRMLRSRDVRNMSDRVFRVWVTLLLSAKHGEVKREHSRVSEVQAAFNRQYKERTGQDPPSTLTKKEALQFLHNLENLWMAGGVPGTKPRSPRWTHVMPWVSILASATLPSPSPAKEISPTSCDLISPGPAEPNRG